MGLYPLGYHYGVLLSCQLDEQLVSVDVSDSFSSILICKISSARPATHHQPELVNLMVDLSFSSPVFIHVVIVLINDFVITFIHRFASGVSWARGAFSDKLFYSYTCKIDGWICLYTYLDKISMLSCAPEQ